VKVKQLKYYKLHNEVISPKFATDGSACFDICAYLDNPVTAYRMYNHKQKINPQTIQWSDIEELQLSIAPADRVLVPTGLVFDIPEGYSVRLHPRSSISLKKGLIMPNGEGIIDSDYYHETFIMLYNSSADEVRIKHGERIAQGELVKTLDYSIEESIIVPEQKTNRVGGFGSTGTK
jgi:dUTP pyrophosphatase|tara:strand:- start:1384 stop:1914 length:531 start_codon:yes stop_codon:yes gene_type:complete